LSRRGHVLALSVAIALAAIAGAPKAVAQTTTTLTIPVFTYHLVDSHIPTDRIGNALTITPAQFEEQLRTLARLHARTLTAAQLVDDLRRKAVPPRAVVLTFDDGYADARTVVFPLLERYHDVATFFVVSGNVGTPRHLSWADIRTMSRAGMEIGGHGREHVDLTELDARGQLAQVAACARALRRWANINPITYAYPSGRYNATTLAVMHRARLAAAFSEDPGEVRSLDNPYRLPRIRVLRYGAVPAFTAIVSAL
jgi:peptidoglycan/xylan/chitin deacetylase (PgdA/CDA1 family)